MRARDRIMALDRQRATARRYRKLHPGPGERLLAAAAIEARAGHLILREQLKLATPVT